jgi:hypothetical protein
MVRVRSSTVRLSRLGPTDGDHGHHPRCFFHWPSETIRVIGHRPMPVAPDLSPYGQYQLIVFRRLAVRRSVVHNLTACPRPIMQQFGINCMHGVVNRELDAVYRATVQIAGDNLVQTRSLAEQTGCSGSTYARLIKAGQGCTHHHGLQTYIVERCKKNTKPSAVELYPRPRTRLAPLTAFLSSI